MAIFLEIKFNTQNLPLFDDILIIINKLSGVIWNLAHMLINISCIKAYLEIPKVGHKK